MTKYVLDTNLYVKAFRGPDDAAALERFYSSFAPAVYLSSVVLHELLVGASTPEKEAQVELSIAKPLRRSNRIVTPSHTAWESAGKTMARLAREEMFDLRAVPKSFVNDVLLAVSCRDAGVTLVTDNVADFRRIRRVTAFEFQAPWPS